VSTEEVIRKIQDEQVKIARVLPTTTQ